MVYGALLAAVLAFPQSGPGIDAGVVRLLSDQLNERAGWAWQAGVASHAPAAANVGGVAALALAEHFELSPNSFATVVTLRQYSEHLRGFYADPSTLPFKADISFLLKAGRLGIVGDGAARARELFSRIRRVSPRGGDEVARIQAGRRGQLEILGYDVALAIHATLALDERRYAIELADAFLAVSPRFDGANPLSVTSTGAISAALVELDPERYEDALTRSVADLLDAQEQNGSWAMNETQATAYAARALILVGLEQARRGEDWLSLHQTGSGAWVAFHDGLPEPFIGPAIPLIHAETLSTMLLARADSSP